MEVSVLYEDDDVVVINKPSGISVHPDGRREEETISDWFVSQYPEAKEVGEPLTLSNGVVVPRPGIVHRLDKDTSGVMVLAKTNEAHAHLKHAFQERMVKKTYRTFLWGALKKQKGIITLPIGRSRSDFRKRSAERHAKEPLREARTDFEVLMHTRDISYVEAKPHTGRMHQIRVHFKAPQNPVVGDMLYAPKKGYALGFQRLALHAFQLSLPLLRGGEKVFEAPLPEDFIKAEKELKELLN